MTKEISTQIQKILPRFIVDDYPMFVAFVEKYIEWSETEGARKQLLDMTKNQDVDTANDESLGVLYRETLPNLPASMVADKKIISRHAKEFYRSRGSQKSYEFLFKMLYDETVQLHYPHKETFRLSDGKWQQRKSIKVKLNFEESGKDWIGRRIRGLTNNGTATVSNSRKLTRYGDRYFEFTLANSTIKGTFDGGETVETLDGEMSAIIVPVVSKVTVQTAGSGYTVGTQIEGNNGHASPIGNQKIQIARVGQNGEIIGVDVINSGFDVINPTVSMPIGTTQGSVICETGGISTYSGSWLNEDTTGLSAQRKLRDGDYYQQFSYVIRSALDERSYRELIKKLVHPLGYALFSEFWFIADVPLENEFLIDMDSSLAREACHEMCLLDNQIDGEVQVTAETVALNGQMEYFSSGNDYAWWDEMKYYHGKFSSDQETWILSTPNYWDDGKTNYPLEQMENIVLGDFETPDKSVDQSAEVYVWQISI